MTRIRYFVAKGNRQYWQPSRILRALGWWPRRLPAERPAAVAMAEQLNAELDAWRGGGAEAPARRGHADPGSIAALVALYRRSEDFQRLRPSTRRRYLQCLEMIRGWAGDIPARGLSPGMVGEWHASLRRTAVTRAGRRIVVETPEKANSAVRVLRLLLSFGRRHNVLADNPAARPALHFGARKGRLWTQAAVDAFVASADAMGWHSVGTAVLLDEWIGQREGDVLGLRRDVYRDGAVRLAQAKTGAEVVLPVGMVPRLVERLEAELARQASAKLTATTLLVCEATGRPWKSDHFRHVFAAIRARAAEICPDVAGLWFMHLRHTAVTRLAEANCELPLIASVTGHSLATVETIIDRYLIRTEAMARAAFQKRLEREGGA